MAGCAVRLVLASGSRARLAVLEQAGLTPVVIRPDIDERAYDPVAEVLGVEEYVRQLAAAKADAVLARCSPGDVVIAADQAGWLDGELLVKPASEEEAIARLMALGGRRHELVNGVIAVAVDGDRRAVAVDRHVVTMRPIDRDAALAYVRAFRPLDSVGAYRVEDDGVAGLIESIEGSGPDGVMGLPLGLTLRLIAEVADDDDPTPVA